MIVLRFPCVTLIVSHQRTRLDDLGVTHGQHSPTDTAQSHHHHRFPGRSHLLSSARRWQGVCRMCSRLSPLLWLSAHTHGHLSRRWVPDTALPLCPCPAGWSHHLAYPVYEVQSRVHRAAALRLTLPPDAPRGRSRCPVGHPWWPEFGAVRGDLPYLADGPLSPDLRSRPTERRDSPDPMWSAPAAIFSR